MDVRPSPFQLENRVADELARAVVGDVPPAVDSEERGADGRQPVGVRENVCLVRAAAERIDVGVLEQEERVLDQVSLPRRGEPLLENPGLAILDAPEAQEVAGGPNPLIPFPAGEGGREVPPLPAGEGNRG